MTFSNAENQKNNLWKLQWNEFEFLFCISDLDCSNYAVIYLLLNFNSH